MLYLKKNVPWRKSNAMASDFEQDDVHQNLALHTERPVNKHWRWLMQFMMSDVPIRPIDPPLTERADTCSGVLLVYFSFLKWFVMFQALLTCQLYGISHGHFVRVKQCFSDSLYGLNIIRDDGEAVEEIKLP